MRNRACLTVALLAVTAAACATGPGDGPVAPSLARVSDDLELIPPPPPPVDTGDSYVDLDVGGAFFRASGRYFANTQGTNAWIDFKSAYTPAGEAIVLASPNARLQYNERTGKTSGKGTLQYLLGDGSVRVLELSQVRITSGHFGACDGSVTPPPTTAAPRIGASCGFASFTVGGGPTTGSILVSARSAIAVVD